MAGSTSVRRSSSKVASIDASDFPPQTGRRTQSAPFRRDRLFARFGQAPSNRAARNAHRLKDRLHPTTARGQRLGRRETTPPTLVQHGIKGSEPHPNDATIDHKAESNGADSAGESPCPENPQIEVQLFINKPLLRRVKFCDDNTYGCILSDLEIERAPVGHAQVCGASIDNGQANLN